MCGAAVASAGMSMQMMAAAPNAPATVLPRSDVAFIVNPLCFGLRSRELPWAAVSAPYLTRGGVVEVEDIVRGRARRFALCNICGRSLLLANIVFDGARRSKQHQRC